MQIQYILQIPHYVVNKNKSTITQKTSRDMLFLMCMFLFLLIFYRELGHYITVKTFN